MTDWPGILSDYRSYLRIERSLSPNTVTSYLSDIAKLRDMYPERGPETSAEKTSPHFSPRRWSTAYPSGASRGWSALLKVFTDSLK